MTAARWLAVGWGVIGILVVIGSWELYKATGPAEGVVVACGEGARKDNGELIAMAVKAGDRILFGKWSGTEVTVAGEELLMMKESDIMGIIE